MTNDNKYELRTWLLKNGVVLALVVSIPISMLVGAFTCYAIMMDQGDVPISESPPPIVEENTETDTNTPIVEPEPEVYYFDVPLSHDLQDYIRELCEKYDVPMELVMAMIEKESSFRVNAVSKTNDYGLMQINKINHEFLRKKLGVTDFLDPYQNVLSGIHIISGHLTKTNGDVELALMRYNSGSGGAKKLWDKGIYSTSYSRTIMKLYQSYKEKTAHGAATP